MSDNDNGGESLMFRSTAIALALCFATVTAQAALLGRAALTPGGTDYQAYYDDRLNITWLADANLAATNTFGVAGICLDNIPPCPSASPPGSMDWYVAHDWVAAMNAASYLGVNNWRLPSADVNGDGIVRDCRFATGALCRDNEMSFQYWRNGIQSSTASPFVNIANYVGIGYYGSGTEYAADPDRRWILNFGIYINDLNPKWSRTYVWAVSPGDLLAIPTPPAVYLFSSALGLMGWIRRKANA